MYGPGPKPKTETTPGMAPAFPASFFPEEVKAKQSAAAAAAGAGPLSPAAGATTPSPASATGAAAAGAPAGTGPAALPSAPTVFDPAATEAMWKALGEAITSEEGINALNAILATRSADINSKDRFGSTPLGTAVESGSFNGFINPALITILLAHGADPAIRVRDHNTPLHLIASSSSKNLENSLATIRALVAHKPSIIDLPDEIIGMTPLLQAIVYKNNDIARLLVELGANVNARDKHHTTPILAAISASPNNPEMVRFLLEHGANPSIKGSLADIDAFDYAIFKNEFDILDILNAHKKQGAAPAGTAASSAATSAASSVAPTTFDPAITKAMWQALPWEEKRLNEILATGRADINAKNERGETPLTSVGLNPEKINILLAYGADPTITDNNGDTPLHLIVSSFSFSSESEEDDKKITAIVKALLSHKPAIIDIQNNRGETPLLRAIENNKPDIVRLLLENGANPSTKNKKGSDAFGYARLRPFGHARPNPVIIKILEDYAKAQGSASGAAALPQASAAGAGPGGAAGSR
jgi:ankyrin repeat protein